MNLIKSIIILVTVLLLSKAGFTQEVATLEITHGPYLQNITKTEATIVFTTNKLVVPGVLIRSGNKEFRLIQNSTNGLVDVGDDIHKIRIKGLQPGINYEYKLVAKEIASYHPYKVVYGDELNSETFSFKTFDSQQSSVNFTVFCDIHDQAEKLAKYLDSNQVEKQDCYFLNGDIMGHIEEKPQIYSSFLDTCVSRFASEIPFFYARGNHETRGKYARNLKNFLDLPNNQYYYAQTIGNIRFIVLDGGEDKPDTTSVYAGLADFDTYRLKELEWLRNEVAGEEFQKAKIKIVIIHMPIIKNKRNWYGMAFLEEHFGPVLQRAKIDLMISGHMHKNNWIEAGKSGFDYPVMICSNNDYVEVKVEMDSIKIDLKNLEGKIVEQYLVEKRIP
ncbi:metallophosphoesterase [Draconibacterium sp.]|nr:metallophosphoesterase [Draconibacterium sp.]